MKTAKKKAKKGKAEKPKTWVEKKIGLNHGLISKKETQVLLMLVQGYENAEIQKKMNIVYDTLKSHRTSILKKAGLENVVQLTHVALKQGLIAHPPVAQEIICLTVADKQKKKLIALAEKKKVTIRKYCEDIVNKALKG